MDNALTVIEINQLRELAEALRLDNVRLRAEVRVLRRDKEKLRSVLKCANANTERRGGRIKVLERALEILGEIGKACPFAWAGQLDECFFEHGAPDEGCPPYNGCARRYAIERARDYVEQARKEVEDV